MSADEIRKVQQFVRNVERVMRDREVSRSELARVARMSRNTIISFLEGYNVPTRRTVRRIASALGIEAPV